MRRFLPVQVLGVLLAVGSLTSVSTPFGIGDVIVRAPIVLTNAAAQVMRAVTDSAAKVSAIGTVRPPRNVPPPHAGRVVSRPTDVTHPGRLDAGRNPETVRMNGLSMRLAPAGVMAGGTTKVVARDRVNRTAGVLRHRFDERTNEPAKLRITRRETGKPEVAKAVRQHRREIEQRDRHRIPPRVVPRRPHRPPSIRPLHRS